MASAQRNAERQQSQIDKFEADLAAITSEKEAAEKVYEEESQRSGLQLTPAQVSSLFSHVFSNVEFERIFPIQKQKYNRLKVEADRHCAIIQQELDALSREQQMDQDSLETKKRKQKERSAKINQKTSELESHRKRVEKLTEQIQ